MSEFDRRPLGELADCRMGETILSKDLDETGYPIFSADSSAGPWGHKKHISKVLKRGSIVLGARGTIGNPRLPNHDEFGCTQTTIAVTPSSKVDPYYLKLALESCDIKQISAQQAVPMLTIGQISQLEIPIPPLPEQKKIAEILSGIDNARAGLVTLREKHRALLTSLRQKIFDESDVRHCTFEEIIEQRVLGTTRRGTGEGSNIPLVKMGDIARGEIKLGANERIEYADDIKDLLLKKGDILFNTRNTPSLVGKTAIFDASMQCCYDNNLMRIRLVPWVSPWFLNHLMNSPRFLQILSSVSSGTTSVAAIYWNDLKRIRIPLPSLPRQQQLSDSFDAVIEVISGVTNKLNGLENIKSATSSELLSGRKRVSI